MVSILLQKTAHQGENLGGFPGRLPIVLCCEVFIHCAVL